MAEESAGGLESKIAALHTKIERESRFTRSLVVICTAAVLGVSIVPIKLMLSDLPKLLVSEVEGSLELLHDHWKILDRTYEGRHNSAGGAATPEGDAGKADKSESK